MGRGNNNNNSKEKEKGAIHKTPTKRQDAQDKKKEEKERSKEEIETPKPQTPSSPSKRNNNNNNNKKKDKPIANNTVRNNVNPPPPSDSIVDDKKPRLRAVLLGLSLCVFFFTGVALAYYFLIYNKPDISHIVESTNNFMKEKLGIQRFLSTSPVMYPTFAIIAICLVWIVFALVCRIFGQTKSKNTQERNSGHDECLERGTEPPVSFENILTKGREVPLNFEVNIRKWMDSTKKYLGCDIIKENKEFKMIADWFSGFKDVHQCSLSALKSIKEMGAITSLSVLSNIWRNVDDLARLVWMKPKAKNLFGVMYKKDKQDSLRMAQKLVKTYCRVVQGEKGKKNVKTHRKQKTKHISFHSHQSILIPVFKNPYSIPVFSLKRLNKR